MALVAQMHCFFVSEYEIKTRAGTCGLVAANRGRRALGFQRVVGGCVSPVRSGGGGTRSWPPLTVMLQWMISSFSLVTLNWQLSSSGFQSIILNRSWFGSKIDSRNFSSAFSPETDIFSSSQSSRPLAEGKSGAECDRAVQSPPWISHVSVRTTTKGWRCGEQLYLINMMGDLSASLLLVCFHYVL